MQVSANGAVAVGLTVLSSHGQHIIALLEVVRDGQPLSLSGCRSSEYSSSLLTALPRAATARAEPAQELIHDGDWLSTQAARSMPAIEPASNVPVILDRLSIVER